MSDKSTTDYRKIQQGDPEDTKFKECTINEIETQEPAPNLRSTGSKFSRLRESLTATYNTVTKSQHWHRLLALVAAGLYCFDVGSDIATGVTYLQGQGDNNSSYNATGVIYLQGQGDNNGSNISSGNTYLQSRGDGKRDIWWGVLTLIFTALGLVVTNFYTWVAYFNDDEDNQLVVKAKRLKVVRNIFLIFQLGALFL